MHIDIFDDEPKRYPEKALNIEELGQGKGVEKFLICLSAFLIDYVTLYIQIVTNN